MCVNEMTFITWENHHNSLISLASFDFIVILPLSCLNNHAIWVLFLFVCGLRVCCVLIPCFWFAGWQGELQLNDNSFWNVSFVLETFTIISKTPLHLAACRGHLEVTKLLVECGVDINMKVVRVELWKLIILFKKYR